MLLTLIMSVAMLAEMPQDDKIPLTIHINWCDYNDEGNLVIAYTIPHPATADRQVPDSLFCDAYDWCNPPRAAVWIRSPGKAEVQVSRNDPPNVYKVMLVLKAGDSIPGYVELQRDELQKLGIAPGDDCEFMLALDELHADRKISRILQTIIYRDNAREWQARGIRKDEDEPTRQKFLDSLSPPRVIPAGEPEVFHFQAASAWVKIQEQPLMSIDNPEKFKERIRAVRDASDEELSQFVENAEPSIALATEWERMVRSKLNQKGEADTKPFFDLLKQKIGTDLNPKWTKVIQESNLSSFNAMSIISKVADRPSVTREEERIVVRQEDNTWVIPTRRGGNAAVAVQDKTAYVALYDDISISYHLYALEEGKVLWSGKVLCPSRRWMFYTGIHSHFVEMTATPEQVVVFGVAAGAYVEAFDAKTGEAILRFSTYHWSDRD